MISLSLQWVRGVYTALVIPSSHTGPGSWAPPGTQGFSSVVTLGFIPLPPGRLQKMDKLQCQYRLTRTDRSSRMKIIEQVGSESYPEDTNTGGNG